MGAAKSIRTALLLGLVLFLVFSEPFAANVRLKEPIEGNELTQFIAKYGPEYPPHYGGKQPRGRTRNATITVGLLDLAGLMLDRRVEMVGMPFAFVGD